MRYARWVLVIGAWTAVTTALSAYGIDRMQSLRHHLLEATRPAPAAATPSGSPSPSPGGPTVLRTDGGNVVALCNDGVVWVQYLSPALGFHIENADQAPAAESHVTFKTDGRELRVVVRCAPEGPRADVTAG
jgi:hypothetical protein